MFRTTAIDGIVVVETRQFHDARGVFSEAYKRPDFVSGGIVDDFVQENQSRSLHGVLRGLHYQNVNPQSKLVRVLVGEAFDVGVDLRRDSPTFGQWHSELLSAENGRQLYLPHGCAHGILALSDYVVFSYKADDVYHPEDEAGVAWNDPDLAVSWPLDAAEIIQSEKDKALPSLRVAFSL